jgi:8-oxo-dGTP diphosphatase
MAQLIDAAVAVLQRPDGQVLLAQRPIGKGWAGWWEFPGGKIEAGETAEQALCRELQEELGLQVVQCYRWLTRVHAYPEKTVRLHFFKVLQWQGEPQSLENQRWAWQHPSQLSVSPLLPANAAIIQALQLPAYYAISNIAEMGQAAFFKALQKALQQGLQLLQVREKQLNLSQLSALLSELRTLCQGYPVKLVLNTGLDIAHSQLLRLASDMGCGVHLTSQYLMQTQAVPAAPRTQLWGASCHNAEQLAQAYQLGLDYALLSPVKATLSHADAISLGWQQFAQLIQHNPTPIYALGGLQKQDLNAAWQAGAHGIAMLRGAWQDE